MKTDFELLSNAYYLASEAGVDLIQLCELVKRSPVPKAQVREILAAARSHLEAALCEVGVLESRASDVPNPIEGPI